MAPSDDKTRPSIILRDTDDLAARHPVFRCVALREHVVKGLAANRSFFDPDDNQLTSVADILECLRRHGVVYAQPRGSSRYREPPPATAWSIDAESPRFEDPVEMLTIDVLDIDTPIKSP